MPAHIPDTPVIGISGASAESKSVGAMMARVRETGAAALLLANHARRDAAKDIAKCDAVIVMGNDYDVAPELYLHRYPEGDPRGKAHPQTRNAADDTLASARMGYERKLIALALAEKMPLFAICGGMQLINVELGGTLHQHIPDLLGHDRHAKNAGAAAANAVIQVQIVPDTLLDRIVKDRSLQATGMPPLVSESGVVNAFHHQSVDGLGKGLAASAYSDSYTAHDGSAARLIEAIEADPSDTYKNQFLLGVQWHPEFLPEATDKILRDMQQAALAFAQSQGRTHPPEEIKMENILSALPILQNIQQFARNRTLPLPSSPNKPRQR